MLMKKNKGNTADIFSAVHHWATPHIIQPVATFTKVHKFNDNPLWQ